MDNEKKKYAVDQIIDDIVILEDLETKEKIERIIYYLPENIHEGSILVYENEEYRIDSDLEMSRRESLRERIDRLKALKNLKKEEEIEETE